jgi:hypothetical protein
VGRKGIQTFLEILGTGTHTTIFPGSLRGNFKLMTLGGFGVNIAAPGSFSFFDDTGA